MSDPIKDLENFDPQGLPMNPLTPSEVRRRGDRMRRRRNGVTALGAAAAVAVIATSGVVIDHAVDRGDEPAPAGPSQTDRTNAEIPDDFPLAAGLEGATETDTALASGLAYCGTTPLSVLEPVDVRSVELSGGDASMSRTLYLLDSPEASVAAHEAILEAAADCADDPDNDGDITVHPPGEGWPGSTVANDHARGKDVFEPAVDIVNVVSAGPALLVTSTATYPTGDIDQNVATQRQDDNKVMVAMADFGEFGAPNRTRTSTSVTTAIPDDFPLAEGWPDESTIEKGKHTGMSGPNRSLDPVEFLVCGEVLPDEDHADRLRADWNNLEDGRSRQLTTYADTDAAAAAVEAIVDAHRACPASPEREDGYVTETEVRQLDVDGADEAWAILERDTMDGSESPFGATSLAIRVGDAVLVMQRGGHSGYPSGDGQERIDEMLSQATTVIDHMSPSVHS